MGSCLKGKAEASAHEGAYKCKKCGGISENKKHVCDPKRIKDRAEKTQKPES